MGRLTCHPWRLLLAPALALLCCLLAPARPGMAQDSKPAASPAAGPATDPTVPVLVHPATQVFPAVDGRTVVWQDERSGPADIFLADLDTGAIRNLTASPQWEAEPAISSPYVVWRDGYTGLGIHGMDITTGTTFTVTTGYADIGRPSISGAVVVWAGDLTGSGDWNIYGYDLSARRPFVIDAAPGRQLTPKVDGDYVVWRDDQGRIFLYSIAAAAAAKQISGSAGGQDPDVSAADDLVVWAAKGDLQAYTISTGATFPLVAAPGTEELPSLGNGLLAYQARSAGGQMDIGLVVLPHGAPFAVTADSALQADPAAGDGVVVWDDTRNHQRDIYRFDWTGTVPPPATYPLSAPASLQVGAYPQNQIVLKWQGAGSGERGFLLERSEGFTTPAWQEIATLPPGTTGYTDTAVTSATTYWYRLRAFNDQGRSAYSPESYSTTIGAVPSLDEQYLVLLINELRAAPADFGYPASAPVPPLAFNPNLGYSARAHSQSILNASAQFGHCDLADRCAGERALDAGYPAGSCTENLLQGTTGPAFMEKAHRIFLSSPGHRASMLDPHAAEVGVGHATTQNTSPAQPWPGQVTEDFCARKGIVPPVIAMGAVVPYDITASDVFTYAANFYAPQTPPSVALVYIDGVPYPLTLSTGDPGQGTYRYIAELTGDEAHSYYFYFAYGDGQVARWPAVGEVRLPSPNPPPYLPLELPLYLPAVLRPK